MCGGSLCLDVDQELHMHCGVYHAYDRRLLLRKIQRMSPDVGTSPLQEVILEDYSGVV